MEPLNLMVSLSYFANSKPTIPPKTKRRTTTKPNPTARHRATTARRALCWLRTITAR